MRQPSNTQKYALNTFRVAFFFLVWNGFVAYSIIIQCIENKYENATSLEPGWWQ